MEPMKLFDIPDLMGLLGSKLFRVFYATTFETCTSQNVLFHSDMSPEKFKSLVSEIVSEDLGLVLIENIEERLIREHGFKKIELNAVNTLGCV